MMMVFMMFMMFMMFININDVYDDVVSDQDESVHLVSVTVYLPGLPPTTTTSSLSRSTCDHRDHCVVHDAGYGGSWQVW